MANQNTLADRALVILLTVAMDERISLRELRDAVKAMARGFATDLSEEAGLRAGRMLADMMIRGRGREDLGEWPEDALPPIMRGAAPTRNPEENAAFILRAAAKARGEVVELPPIGTNARLILDADAKRRGEKPK